MKAGFAEIVITPPDGKCLLAGYNLRPSTGVHDDLFACAVYFEDGPNNALLISYDLLAMERELIARLKSAVQQTLQIQPDHIFFTCTHTHEGPEVRERKFRDRWYGEERPDYLDAYQAFLIERTSQVAQTAAAKAQEFDLTVNRAYVDENMNRRFFLSNEQYLGVPGSQDEVRENQVYAWNPSITGTKMEDTVLIGAEENVVLTAIPEWPTIPVGIGGKVYKRPAILVQD